MARIPPKLIERLHKKLNVGRSQLYALIDKTGRQMGMPRHLAAVAFAASRGINVNQFATDEYYTAIRGATNARSTDAASTPASASETRAASRRDTRGARSSRSRRRPGRIVFVVHGRDEPLRRAIFDFLRAVGLSPIEWSKARAMTGKPNPVISEILDVAFSKAAAVVVVLSPDDEAKLAGRFIRPHDPPHEKKLTGQPRPNVLWEGGMAWAHSADHTVLVQVGNVRPFSDIAGHHILRLTDAPEDRTDFVARLKSAGCEVDDSGRDWMSTGTFVAVPGSPRRRSGR